MSVISSELGVSAIEGRIAVSFGFLDSIERFPSSVADSLYACGSLASEISCYRQGGQVRAWFTRCGEPFCSGYVVMSSWILGGG